MQFKTGIYAVYSPWNKDWHLTTSDSDMTTEGWVLVKTLEMDVELPPKERLVAMTAEALRVELEEMRARHYRDEQAQEEVVRELLCLEAPKND